ncbi:purine-binding chemotaxis protein CheW [Aneurinibacillus soli]|uniref:Chemotaxis protein CheW n=1 Tax=Aneurinibacillus soli TaxID=1500254 RepID=A0A0U5B5C9_9BACL|nr:chemotaxis protein CheW [Aneurinibacillus soli]PYE58044.1 purine-binding chemotaxis protein CheW [Aneurinibacillus soli]BAU29922.1 Chemotaxis protein CheW [Aneurinibacillus soli]
MEENSESGQYVVFSIAEQVYALYIDQVIEIIRMQTITEVPEISFHIAGVINLRGKILPVVHLRKRFAMPGAPFTKKTRIVIVHFEGEQVGLIVDEVRMVTLVHDENIDPAPDMFNYVEQDCFEGFASTENGLVGILHLKRVLLEHIPEGEGGVKA